MRIVSPLRLGIAKSAKLPSVGGCARHVAAGPSLPGRQLEEIGSAKLPSRLPTSLVDQFSTLWHVGESGVCKTPATSVAIGFGSSGETADKVAWLPASVKSSKHEK
jgi:hypothetical protein